MPGLSVPASLVQVWLAGAGWRPGIFAGCRSPACRTAPWGTGARPAAKSEGLRGWAGCCPAHHLCRARVPCSRLLSLRRGRCRACRARRARAHTASIHGVRRTTATATRPTRRATRSRRTPTWTTPRGRPRRVCPSHPRGLGVDQVAARLLLARGLSVLMPVARVARSQGTPPSLVSPRRNGEAPPRRPRACWPRRSHGHRRRRPHRGPTPTPTTAAACVTPPRAACTRTPAAWRGRSRIGAMLGRSCCGCPRVCATRAASIASSFLSENPY